MFTTSWQDRIILMVLTKKKFLVDPDFLAPYCTSSTLSAKSLTLSMELVGFSMVRKAAKLAVYEDTMINVKNHQIADIVRVLKAL